MLHVYNYLTNDLGLKIDSLQNILSFILFKSPKKTNQHPLQLLDFNLVISIYYTKQINVNICSV